MDKPVRVLSGGERTRLAVARMLLRPSNTLLLDEPTNHLDLDSKDVLLEALEDFGGTLIFVSHDRYFVDKLATKVIEIGGGQALIYPGTYEEFLWSRRQQICRGAGPRAAKPHRRQPAKVRPAAEKRSAAPADNGTRGRLTCRRAAGQGGGAAVVRRTAARRGGGAPRKKAADSLRRADRRARGADRGPREGDQGDRGVDVRARLLRRPRCGSRPIIDRHQALMWEVGDLMNQWEALQTKS